ncbi:MAG: hypothetical protein LBR89_04170 [Holosporales bacterium]|jgi:hypothetical protein|nr:hypothetical protein [Holosporales bacterium]
MVDFGILSALRQLIDSEGVGRDYGLSLSSVYIMEPDVAPVDWPAVYLTLEESWSVGSVPGGTVMFKVSILSNSDDGMEALDIANQIRQLIDGASLEVEMELDATLRMNSSIVDMKKVAMTPRRVEQFYEAFVRSAPAESADDYVAH